MTTPPDPGCDGGTECEACGESLCETCTHLRAPADCPQVTVCVDCHGEPDAPRCDCADLAAIDHWDDYATDRHRGK